MITLQIDWSKAPEWANYAYITKNFKIVWSENEMGYDGWGWSCPLRDNQTEVDSLGLHYGVHPQLKAERKTI